MLGDKFPVEARNKSKRLPFILDGMDESPAGRGRQRDGHPEEGLKAG